MKQTTDLSAPPARPTARARPRLRRRRLGPLVALLAAAGFAPTHASAEAPQSVPPPVGAGDLDPSYGVGGRVTTPVAWQSFVEHPLALQPDGRAILVGQAVESGDSDVLVVRRDAGGGLDPSFGTGGKVVTRLGPGEDLAQAVDVTPGGAIVVAGWTEGDFFVLRYLPNGQLDPSFGAGGKAVTDVPGGYGIANDVAVAPDGSIVVAGSLTRPDGAADLALVRYTAAGALDATFGAGGMAFAAPVAGAVNAARAIALGPDGAIVLAGYARVDQLGDPTGADWLMLARYDAGGSPDETFGRGGFVLRDEGEGEWLSAIALEVDGRVVAGGRLATGGGQSVLLRHLEDGSPDPTFGAGGLDLRPGWGDVSALVLQPHGESATSKIITAGSLGGDFVLTRRGPDGDFDPGFGAGGAVVTDFGAFEGATGLALDGEGKLIAAGMGSFPHQFELARYFADAGPVGATVLVGGTLRSGPSDGYPPIGKVTAGDAVIIACTARGEPAHGPFGLSNVWDRLDDGSWVPDAWLLTGSAEPAAPACPAGSEAPPIGPDDYAYDPASEAYNDFGLLFCAHRDTSVAVASPGLTSLIGWLHGAHTWPAGSTLDGGIFGTGIGHCRTKPSTHNDSRGLDWGLDRRVPAQRAAAFALVDELLASDERGEPHALARALGVQEIIYDDKVWDMRPGNRENGLVIDYDRVPGNGCLVVTPDTKAWTDLHCDHVHLALHYEGANRLNAFWR